MIVPIVVVCIVVIIVLIVIIGALLVTILRKTSKKHENTWSSVDVVPVVPNPAYQDPRNIISQRNRNIITDTNPSYSHILPVNLVPN